MTIDIYDKNIKTFPKSTGECKDWDNVIRNMANDKIIRYLTPVVIGDVFMPVTLIVDDFVECHNKIRKGTNDMKCALYNSIFGYQFDKLYTSGAFTTLYVTDVNFGIYHKEDINQNGKLIIGFIIIVDKRIVERMNLDSIVYHEYYHCLSAENGILSQNLSGIFVPGKTDYYPKDIDMNVFRNQNIVVDNEEERLADAFSRENISKKMQLWKLGQVICDLNGVHNIFGRIYVNLVMTLGILLQGRNIL